MDTINEKLLKGNDIWNGRQYIQHNEDDIIQDLFLGQFVFHELYDRTRWRVTKKLMETCITWKIWQVLPTQDKTSIFEQRFECCIDNQNNILNHSLTEFLKNPIKKAYFLHIGLRMKWFLKLKKKKIIRISNWQPIGEAKYRLILDPIAVKYMIQIKDRFGKVRLTFDIPEQIKLLSNILSNFHRYVTKGKLSRKTIRKYKLNEKFPYLLKNYIKKRERRFPKNENLKCFKTHTETVKNAPSSK